MLIANRNRLINRRCECTMTGDNMAFTAMNIYCVVAYLSSARFALNNICGTGTDDRIAPRTSVDKVNSISIMAFYWRKSRKPSRMDDTWYFYAAYTPRPVYTPVSSSHAVADLGGVRDKFPRSVKYFFIVIQFSAKTMPNNRLAHAPRELVPPPPPGKSWIRH